MQGQVPDADRNIFRDRLKAAIKAAKTSAKEIEEEVGVPKGTFLKIYKGKEPLTPEVLEAAADKLGVEAGALVAGTGFDALIAAEPEPQPEPESVEETPTEVEDDKPPDPDTPTEVDEDDTPAVVQNEPTADELETGVGSMDRASTPSADEPDDEPAEASLPKATPPPTPEAKKATPKPAPAVDPPKEEEEGLVAKIMSFFAGLLK